MRCLSPIQKLLLGGVFALLLVGPARAEVITSRLVGGFRYQDSDGDTRPVTGVDVEVHQITDGVGGVISNEDILVSYTSLDQNGNFDITVSWDYDPGGFLYGPTRLVVILFTKVIGGLTNVENADGTYQWTLEPEWDDDHYLGQYGIETPASEDLNTAIHLWIQVRQAEQFIASHWGSSLDYIHIIYPADDEPFGGSYSKCHLFGNIYLPRSSLGRDDHLFRLLGRHWLTHQSDGQCDDPATACGFCDWCEGTEETAWSEGFGLFFADEITRWLQVEDPQSSLHLHDFESIAPCVDDDYGFPQTTPGNVAALLLDLVDPPSPADFNDQYPFYDSVGGLLDDVVLAAREESTSNVMDFLVELYTRAANQTHDIWATAMGDGFASDTTAPGPVTNLTSSSHAVGVVSADNTVDFTWTRALDDISDVQGYSIQISGNSQMPPDFMTDGNVDSYTSAQLSPGTYYMTIRSVDWAGNWSTSFASYGPFTITDPSALDLAYLPLPDWDYVSFPSQGDENSSISAHVTPVLTGEATDSHWNVTFQNLGPADTDERIYIHAFVDDQVVSNSFFWNGLEAGESHAGTDVADFSVRGGRHNFHTLIDGQELATETDEENNIHGRQFVWSGHSLVASSRVTRPAPPYYMAGAGNVTSPMWYVCDGLSFETAAWWSAVAVRPRSDVSNYSCRLHDRSTGSENGFGSNRAYSSRPAGTLDAVIVNRNQVGYQAWDVGVLNQGDSTADYDAVMEPCTSFVFGDSLTFSFGAERMIMLKEVQIAAADTGRVTVTLDVGSAPDPLTVLWLDSAFETGTLLDFTGSATTGIDGRAQLNLQVHSTGYYCVVLYRDAYGVTEDVDVVMEVNHTPADLTPLFVSGWYAPLVPRPGDDGTYSTVDAPASLAGNSLATYFNLATTNQGYLPAVSAHVGVSLDGSSLFGFTYGTFPVGAQYRTNNHNPFVVRGGRHTVSLLTDPYDTTEEMDENNNTYGRQYIWSPLEVPFGSSVSRESPPDRIGGWSEAGSGWYNCDGLRMPSPTGSWAATAVLPVLENGNPDLRLHHPQTGVDDGFSSSLTTSNWTRGLSDFVAVNFHLVGKTPYDVGAIEGSTGADQQFYVQTAQSTFLGAAQDIVYGPFTCGENQIISLHEWYIEPGIRQITLENLSGVVDWGISVLPVDQIYMSKTDIHPGGIAWQTGPGGNETLKVEFAQAGYFCLAVWKKGSSDLGSIGKYQIRLGPHLSSARDDGTPLVTKLNCAAPNPFNPMTTIHYSLARSGDVSLVVYDLSGAQVRALAGGNQEAGERQVVWKGTDSSGRSVSSGVYMVRLVVDGEFAGIEKLLLVK